MAVELKDCALEKAELNEAEWRQALDHLSKALAGSRAEIEVISTVADSLCLLGVTFDPNDDILDVALEGLDHMIKRPREIFLDQRDGQLTAIKVVDANGDRHFIKLKEPIALASAT